MGKGNKQLTAAHKEFLAVLGLQLKAARHRKKLTQQAAADLMKMDRSFLSMVESGQHNPSIITIMRLSIVYEVSIASIMEAAEHICATGLNLGEIEDEEDIHAVPHTLCHCLSHQQCSYCQS